MRNSLRILWLTGLLAIAGTASVGLAQVIDTQGPALENQLDRLLAAVATGDDSAVLQRLESAATDPQFAALDRDELMASFIDRLRTLAPGSVSAGVLDYLRDYPAQAMRPDEHQPDMLVPVYNFRAATQGLENTWRRQEATYAGAVLLSRDPAGLVQAYALHDEPAIRRGLLAALDSATHGQLEMISFMALSAMDHEPALADLAGAAALKVGDTRAVEQLVRTGNASSIARTLRASRQVLSPIQVERLLDTAIEHATPEIASVAIAELTPALANQPGADERLFVLLDDPKLGASAALALAARPSDTTIARLGEIAHQANANALAAHRARLALELFELQAAGEVLP